MTIAQIKQLSKSDSPYFFDKKTLKFFGQTLSSFKTKKQPDGRIKIYAPMRNPSGEVIGETVRFFNPINNKLEHS